MDDSRPLCRRCGCATQYWAALGHDVCCGCGIGPWACICQDSAANVAGDVDLSRLEEPPFKGWS